MSPRSFHAPLLAFALVTGLVSVYSSTSGVRW